MTFIRCEVDVNKSDHYSACLKYVFHVYVALKVIDTFSPLTGAARQFIYMS